MSGDFDTWGTDSPRRMREALARIMEIEAEQSPVAIEDMGCYESLGEANGKLARIREEAERALQVSAGGGK